jgi:hypothetical protein
MIQHFETSFNEIDAPIIRTEIQPKNQKYRYLSGFNELV